MPGLGTIINTIAIFIGGGLGLLLKKGLPERFRSIIFLANGTSVFFMGVAGVLSVCLTITTEGLLDTRYLFLLLISLLLGGVLGELLRIDRGFDRLGGWIERRMSTGDGKAAQGFAYATILFCSGAMAIIGGMQDGMGDPSMLLTKAVLDAVTGFIFAASYGPGVLFAGIAVFVYQGIFALLAGLLQTALPMEVITQMSMAGSAVLMLLAFSMWEIKKVKVANLIPATFMPVLLYLGSRMLG